MPTITADRTVHGYRVPARGLIAAVLACSAAFAGLTAQLLLGGALDGEDQATRTEVLVHQWGWLHALMTGVSIMGSAVIAPALLLALAAVLSFRARRPTPLLIAGGAIALLAAGVTLGKDLIGRGRPGLAVDAVHVGGASFPSGHTTTAVVAAGVTALLLRGHTSALTGRTLWWLAGAFALAVGLSRIYLDAHWLTDVLAGWALGAALLGVVVLLTSRWAAPDPCARAPQRVCDVPEGAR